MKSHGDDARQKARSDAGPGAGITILFAVGVMQLLYFNWEPDAAMRQTSEMSPEAQMRRTLHAADDEVQSMAGGGNLELHFVGFDPHNFQQGMVMSEIYFRANYALYPKRAIVGQGNLVINDAADIAREDVVPDAAWLTEHQVNAVMTRSAN